MDKFKVIEFFSNSELFKKISQRNVENGETEFRFESKRLDYRGNTRSFVFRCRRRNFEVGYVNMFIEDISERFFAAKIYDMRFLKLSAS